MPTPHQHPHDGGHPLEPDPMWFHHEALLYEDEREYAIGVAYVHALARYRADGFPVSTVVPPDTVGEVGALAIIANGPNPEGARAFVDFVLSAEAQTAFAAQSFTTPLNPDAAVPEGAPPRDSFDMIDYDAELAGEQRDEVLLRWQQVVD